MSHYTFVAFHIGCYNSCFADTSKIFVKTDEGDVILKQLRGVKVGDKVQSVDPKTGELVFSEVVFMDHDDDPNPWQEVLKFSYHDGKDEVELCTTPNHLIYASESAERYVTYTVRLSRVTVSLPPCGCFHITLNLVRLSHNIYHN